MAEHEKTIPCDICEENFVMQDGELPRGWLKLKIEDEDGMDEYSVHKDICAGCVMRIEDQAAKARRYS